MFSVKCSILISNIINNMNNNVIDNIVINWKALQIIATGFAFCTSQ